MRAYIWAVTGRVSCVCLYLGCDRESELCVLIFGQVMGEGAGYAYMYIGVVIGRMRCVYLHLDW